MDMNETFSCENLTIGAMSVQFRIPQVEVSRFYVAEIPLDSCTIFSPEFTAISAVVLQLIRPKSGDNGITNVVAQLDPLIMKEEYTLLNFDDEWAFLFRSIFPFFTCACYIRKVFDPDRAYFILPGNDPTLGYVVYILCDFRPSKTSIFDELTATFSCTYNENAPSFSRAPGDGPTITMTKWGS